ncbi:MAG: AhpC/TSA family protein [Pseudomonadales bacterium]|nr:AhpC/TSA family protein [Pseudomonadales bacterium]
MATLAEELKVLQGHEMSHMPEDVLKRIASITKELIAGEIEKNALGIGDPFPDFELSNTDGEVVTIPSLLEKADAVVINFYHGQWCPFCNYEINAYQQVMSKIRALRATFVGISPQLPDHAFSPREKRRLNFDVLFDKSNELAKRLGIVFELKGPLKDVYSEFGYDIPECNGDDTWQLPISSTYIVNKSGDIAQCFVDADYVHRTDPQQVLRILELMMKGRH